MHFSVLEMGFVHQILICSPCFCHFHFSSLQFPSNTGIVKIFFSYMSLSWRERGDAVLTACTFPGNMVLDDPTRSPRFYQSCDPTAEEEAALIPPLLQGHESCEQQPLRTELIRPWSAVIPSLLSRFRTSWPWEEGTLLPEPVHLSHVSLYCLSPCVAIPCLFSLSCDVLQWRGHCVLQAAFYFCRKPVFWLW